VRTSAAMSLASSCGCIAATCRDTSSTHVLVASTVVHVRVDTRVYLVSHVAVMRSGVGASSVVVVASHASPGCGSVLTSCGAVVC
jgi:hypothetical protein